MPELMNTPGDPPAAIADLQALVDRVFAAVEAKNLDGVLRCFADDGVLIDPHYPTPRMAGKLAIAGGMSWLFWIMNTPSFKVIHYFASSDGQRVALEVDTNHLLRSGTRLRFSQVFIVETRDGLLTRLQAYEPYGPAGISGIALRLSHLWFRATSKRRSLKGLASHSQSHGYTAASLGMKNNPKPSPAPPTE